MKKYHTMKQLYNNKTLFNQTVALINHNVSYRKITKFLKDKKFHASLSMIQNLVKKIRYSHQNSIPIGKLIDKRKYNKHKKSLETLKKQGRLQIDNLNPEIKRIVNTSLNNSARKVNQVHVLPRNTYYSTKVVLDLQIQQYYEELKAHKLAKGTAKHGLKAIELENKYNGDDALSLQAIKQYELINYAHFRAIGEIAMELMPKKMHKEFVKEVSETEKGILEQTQVSPGGKKLYTVLKEQGLDI